MADKEREDTRMGAAIVSGAFATVVALITGIFGWLNRDKPAPSPTPPVVISSVHGSDNPSTNHVATISGRQGSSEKAAPNLKINFAAYQRIVRSRETTDKEKQKAVDECKGELVVWRGYVDEVSPNPEIGEKAYTVTLCEDKTTLSQSLFKQPAFCRFEANPLDQISSLQHGQNISISGTFAERSAVGTEILNCKLVKLHD